MAACRRSRARHRLGGDRCSLYRPEWRRDSPPIDVEAPAFDRWQTARAWRSRAVVAAFLFTTWPRELVALDGGRRAARQPAARLPRHARAGGLAPAGALHRALRRQPRLAQSGFVGGLLMASRMAGADLTEPPVLFAVTAVLSNIVSNVPAVMLLLPAARDADRWRGAGALVHARRQPDRRRQHREHHRGRSGGAPGCWIDWRRARARRRAGRRC